MSDYIPRQMAIEILDNLCRKCGNKDMAFALNWAVNEIQNLPQYDVREAASSLPLSLLRRSSFGKTCSKQIFHAG